MWVIAYGEMVPILALLPLILAHKKVFKQAPKKLKSNILESESRPVE
jgi:hypothetical protein